MQQQPTQGRLLPCSDAALKIRTPSIKKEARMRRGKSISRNRATQNRSSVRPRRDLPPSQFTVCQEEGALPATFQTHILSIRHQVKRCSNLLQHSADLSLQLRLLTRRRRSFSRSAVSAGSRSTTERASKKYCPRVCALGKGF